MKREEMIAVIADWGSVLHEGRLHTSIATLPSKAALAQTDTEKAAAVGDLDAQIAALQAQRAALDMSNGQDAEGKNLGGGGDEAETFESLMKLKHEDLFKKAEPIAKEKGVELDPKSTKATLSRFILGEPEPAE